MENWDFYLVYQRVIYMIVHYCSLWAILTCIIASGISWRLFTLLSAQNSSADDAYLAWWTTVLWGSASIFFFLVGLIFA